MLHNAYRLIANVLSFLGAVMDVSDRFTENSGLPLLKNEVDESGETELKQSWLP